MMSRIFSKLFLLGVSFLLIASSLSAEEISFTASVNPEQFPIGATAQLTVTIKGTKENIQPIELPAVEGLDIKFSGSFSNSLNVNGQSSISRNFLYTIYPSKVGHYEIPKLTTSISGKDYSSQPLAIDVTQEPLLNANNQPSGASATNISDKIFLVMSVPQSETYISQPIALTIKLYVNKLHVRDIQMKELKQDGFQKVDSLKARQYSQIISGVGYDVVEFMTTIYPLREGDLVLGPAKLGCSVLYPSDSSSEDPMMGSLFQSYDSRPMDVSSQPLNIKVLALPTEGKPQDFSGAVGQFQFAASVGPQEVNVGDPLTLKMSLSGQGNIKAAELPQVKDDRFKTYDPQTKQDDTFKSVEQVIIPTTDQVKEVPALEFNYFDPQLKQYRTITQGPFPVVVKPADKEQEFKAVEFQKPVGQNSVEPLGQDIVFIKEDMGRILPVGNNLLQRFGFWLAMLIYTALAAGLIVFYQVSSRMKTDTGFARRIKAPRQARKGLAEAKKVLASGEVKDFYSLLEKILREYLGNKLHIPAVG